MTALPPTFVLLTFLGFATSQNLNYTMTKAKLVSARGKVGAVYDGDDSIFIFGDYITYISDLPISTTEILKYTISTDKISLAGRLPNGATFLTNSISFKSNGNIIAFKTGSRAPAIFEFNPATYEAQGISNYSIDSNPIFKVSQDRVIIFGCYYGTGSRSVLAFDLKTLNITELHGDVGAHMKYGAFDAKKNVIYCIGYNTTAGNTDKVVMKFDLNTDKLYVAFKEPAASEQIPSGAVWKDGKMYAVDAWVDNGQGQTLEVFDPAVPGFQFLPVGGDVDGGPWHHRGMAYVEKLSRIYLFGGLDVRSSFNFLHDAVGYIELSGQTLKSFNVLP